MATNTLQRTQRRGREVAGPGVGAVAIISRPVATVPKDLLITQRRQYEDTLRSRAEAAEEMRVFNIKSQWEQNTDSKIKATKIQRRVDELLQQRKLRLRERQLKLRALLEEEEQQYSDEIAAQVETPLEKEAKMREKLRQLRDTRESKRQEEAAVKMEQHFLANCEPLRTLRSKQDTMVIEGHRQEQIREKHSIAEREREVSRIYDSLWEQDKQSKDKRATDEEAARRTRNAEQREVLTLQIAAVEENRQWMARIKQQQEQARLEEAILAADEEKRQQQMMAEDRRKHYAQLSRFNKAQAKEQQRRQAEEQALEERVVLAALEAHAGEQQQLAATQNQWREEAKAYLAYLADQRAQQAQVQAELNSFYDSEAERMWQRRAQQWEAERNARSALMKEVIEVRKLQVAAKLEALYYENQQAEAEAATLAANVEAHRKEESTKEAKLHDQRMKHARDLELQIVVNAEQRAQSRREELEHQDRLVRTQALVDEKTQRALSGLSIRAL